jgi:hypothetical protein
MQGTQRAICAGNEEMTPEYPKQVSEEMKKAPFVMQEEVKEAEAALDACYRRRVRGQG